MKVSEAVAGAVVSECPGTPVFSLIGDTNLPLAGSLDRDAGARQVMARHEQAAVAMADGYAQATGTVGLATITAGPGLTHAATSLFAASRMHTPMVVLTGDVPRRRPAGLHAMAALDHRRFAGATDVLFEGLESPDSVAEDVRSAFYRARTQRRPVILNVPVDLQAVDLAGDWRYEPSADLLPKEIPLPLAEEGLHYIIKLLTAARRPLIIAGRGAQAADESLRRVARAAGALLGTTLPAKGLFDSDPWCLGVVGGYSRLTALELIRQADLVLAFGAELGHFTTQAGTLFEGRTVVRIESSPATGPMPLVAHSVIQADAGQAANALVEALGDGDGEDRFRTSDTRTAIAAVEEFEHPPTDGRLDPRALMRALGVAIPPDAVVVVGGGHFTSFPCMYTDCPPDGQMFFPFGSAAVGQTVPFALGVAVARPDRPLIVIEGDGSLLMNIQELETATRLNTHMLVIVMNDAALTAERLGLSARGYDPELVCYPSPDFPAIADGFGWHARRLERPEDLVAAVDTYARCGEPMLLDAQISREITINPVGLHNLSATL